MIDLSIDERALRAWIQREACIGRVLRPETDARAFGEVLPHGYTHGDCVDVAFDGPLRIAAITQAAFFAGEYAPRDGDLVDTYYSVDPVGWTPMDGGAEVRGMWIFGPSYRREVSERIQVCPHGREVEYACDECPGRVAI